MKRWAGIAALLTLSCGGAPPSLAGRWTTGFWFWDGSHVRRDALTEEIDVLYVQAGTARSPDLPAKLPKAKEYWAVLRFDERAAPGMAAAAVVGRGALALRAQTKQRNLPFGGLQLDIDCPTRALGQYAAFLREVKKAAGPGVRISITALLDWFREGTDIAAVLAEVDEFAPQFYDLEERDSYDGGKPIAAPIDGRKWGPIFNRFGKPYRIGISTFGRMRFVAAPREGSAAGLYAIGNDWHPLQMALQPAFAASATKTAAGELLLRYRATRPVKVDYTRFGAGDAVEFTLATPEAMATAVAQAKRMGGFCRGVLFFRWPSGYEPLTAQPVEVLMAAGTIPARELRAEVRATDGGCAAVHCMDIFLFDARPFSPLPVRYRIDAGVELEYFIPKEGMPARMSAPSEIEIALPPYGSRGRTYLGRAVTAKPAQFRILEEGR